VARLPGRAPALLAGAVATAAAQHLVLRWGTQRPPLGVAVRCAGGAVAVPVDDERRGFPRDEEDSRRRVSPSNARNKGLILEVLRKHLLADAAGVAACGASGVILEIASGTGEHLAHFAAALPEFSFQPSEWNGHASLEHQAQDIEDICQSISAWTEGLPNVLRPIALDASAPRWPDVLEPVAGESPHLSAIVASNIAHIAPPEVVRGLLDGAGRLLRPSGLLFLYGPFAVSGQALAEGNSTFDEKLKATDETWGLREVGEVVDMAGRVGLHLVCVEDMPSNNKTLIFAKQVHPHSE